MGALAPTICLISTCSTASLNLQLHGWPLAMQCLCLKRWFSNLWRSFLDISLYRSFWLAVIQFHERERCFITCRVDQLGWMAFIMRRYYPIWSEYKNVNWAKIIALASCLLSTYLLTEENIRGKGPLGWENLPIRLDLSLVRLHLPVLLCDLLVFDSVFATKITCIQLVLRFEADKTLIGVFRILNSIGNVESLVL